MKLKSRPEDFIVHEINSFEPDPGGSLFVYELKKRSLATMEALAILARFNGVRVRDLSAAGLKDKHGLTHQLFSAPRPLKAPDDERLRISLQGKCATPLTAASILGNRFSIVVRNLKPADLETLPRNLEEIRRLGVPNYYDNQRFGGIAHGQGFIGRALVLGDYEEALRLYLAAPHRKQSLKDKQNRRLARDLWGDWATLHRRMKKSPERALVEFLHNNPGQWAACFDRIPPTLRNLFVAAYQSYLFNETVAAFIRAEAAGYATLRNRAGEMVFHRGAERPHWSELLFPLPGAATKIEDFPEAAPHLRTVLEREAVKLEAMGLDGLPRTRIKAGSRRLLIEPTELDVSDPDDDGLNPAARCVRLAFSLPRGSFATIITRRLFLQDRS